MSEKEFPGIVEDYHGYSLYRFDVGGLDAIIVEPKIPKVRRQWIWKAEFFSAFPNFELAMLERGFYLAFLNVGNTFGCPSAMTHFDEFYTILTEKYSFASHPVLLGLSRGGLYVYNWAVKNTDKVSCIYADNAVCDFKSWPGGKGDAPDSLENWTKLIEDYGFAFEDEALEYSGNPIDNLEPLAKAGIPLIHASATEDEIVPISENTDILEARYKALGGNIKVIRHPGKHHPHGLENPEPVINFIHKYGYHHE
ncbi:MAG: hypothetical protein L3J71_04590 [Victivallaceae bacterium]|nr:hypothetical protein [Victivallaceae bacterium]